jgi:glycolate oxidase
MTLRIDEVAETFRGILGREWVITERGYMESYLRDETPDASRPQAAESLILLKPSSTEEVSQILKTANDMRIPVFPVGGRTGLVGGCVPTEDGIILSLERMNRIEVDGENLMVIAEAGATLADLIKAADEAGLFFPLHPGEEGAQIGGLISTNAGGVRAVKYGVMRNYVKGLEVVLATGEVLNLGGPLIKNNTGYDLMDLIIGSEGTLCVITRAVIKLYPKSGYSITLILPYDKRSDAIRTVPKIIKSGIIPLAIEYVGINELNKATEHIGEKWPVQDGNDQLIIILSGQSEDEVYSACERISEVAEENNAKEAVIAETREEQERILRIRSNIYTALKAEMIDILDVTVPMSRLGDLMNSIDEIAQKYGVYLPVYGHAGDGNLHIHLMKENDEVPEYVKEVKKEIYDAGVRLGGVITGEHGIGQLRIREFERFISGKEVSLMREIKRIFDPNNILNPGKVFPPG